MDDHEINSRALRAWRTEQCKSFFHIACVILVTVTVFAGFFSLPVMLGVYGTVFLATALVKAVKVLIYAAIAAIVTAIFPPLGAILAIVFLFLKFAGIAANWKAILVGILVYAVPVVFVLKLASPHSIFVLSKHVPLGTAALCAVMCGLAFHLLLLWLYHGKFSSSQALIAVGSTPVIFIMLILPVIMDGMNDGPEFSDYDAYEDAYDHSPGYHDVSGHWRHTENGGMTYVDAHVRTNPDGIQSNNLSNHR